MMRIGMVSLGCSKNRVDSELILGGLVDSGFGITSDPAESEILIVNTCGFITPAKEESINTILEMAQYKQTGSCRFLVVTGCLSERYHDELKLEIPEIDLLWGVRDHKGLIQGIAKLAGVGPNVCAAPRRLITTPPYSAYLRIADGCDNRCAYCAIPLIRGGRRSVPMEDLVAEARSLADGGVVELTLIAQDTSAYGTDLYGKPMLGELLKRLAAIDGLVWIRVLYAYPNTVTEELVDTILSNDKLVNYLDIPVQHIDPSMLKSMNRHGTREHIEHMIGYIRSASDSFILRTTVMVGFPGEDDRAFGQLADFLERNPFDRLGAFMFSPEDNTPAANMPDQVPDEIKQRRLDLVMRIGQRNSLELNRRRVGRFERVLVERTQHWRAYGRSYGEAPEVDGRIALSGFKGRPISPGSFVDVRIVGASEYDLKGEVIEHESSK